MREWRTLNGRRTWSRFNGGATWDYAPDGMLAAWRASSTPLDLSPATALADARKLVTLYAGELGDLVADVAGGEFYRRALLSLIAIECTHGLLPCYGDCRDAAGKVVPCGPSGDGARSVGLYQLIRATAIKLGFAWSTLANDTNANHRAALKLARSLEPQHGGDFVTLAVLWNAGSVHADPSNDFGAHTWSPTLVTKYARAWNAVGVALAETGPTRSSVGGGVLLAALFGAWLASCSPTTAERQAETIANEACRELLQNGGTPQDVARFCEVERVAVELVALAELFAAAQADGGAPLSPDGGAPAARCAP